MCGMYATEYRVRAPAAPAPQTASEAAPLAHVGEQSLLGDVTSPAGYFTWLLHLVKNQLVSTRSQEPSSN